MSMAADLYSLDGLREMCLSCRKCEIGGKELFPGKFSNVWASGDAASKIVFCAQNPAEMEVKQGIPLVGPSGKKFEELLSVFGLKRSEVWITNLIKCCTPENRKPEESEIRKCTGAFLLEELNIIRPRLVITMGDPAYRFFSGMTGISANRGFIGRPKPSLYNKYGFYLYPILHPGAAIYESSRWSDLVDDAMKLKFYLPVILKRKEVR